MKKLGRFIGNDEENFRVGCYIIDKYNVFRNQAYYGYYFLYMIKYNRLKP